MPHLIDYLIGFLFGGIIVFILLGSKLYIFYKEKYQMSQTIKRLEKANSRLNNTVNFNEINIH